MVLSNQKWREYFEIYTFLQEQRAFHRIDSTLPWRLYKESVYISTSKRVHSLLLSNHGMSWLDHEYFCMYIASSATKLSWSCSDSAVPSVHPTSTAPRTPNHTPKRWRRGIGRRYRDGLHSQKSVPTRPEQTAPRTRWSYWHMRSMRPYTLTVLPWLSASTSNLSWTGKDQPPQRYEIRIWSPRYRVQARIWRYNHQQSENQSVPPCFVMAINHPNSEI